MPTFLDDLTGKHYQLFYIKGIFNDPTIRSRSGSPLRRGDRNPQWLCSDIVRQTLTSPGRPPREQRVDGKHIAGQFSD
jgi:hypothetical protein